MSEKNIKKSLILGADKALGSAGIRLEGFADEVSLGMAADGADLWGFGGGVDVTAVEADPDGLSLIEKEFSLLQHVGVHRETVSVGTFDLGDHGKMSGDLGVALFSCFFGKSGIGAFEFFVFVVMGGAEQREGAAVVVDGICGADVDVFVEGAFGDEVVIEDLAVLFFLIGGEEEDLFQQLITFFLCLSCGVGIAISRL